MTTKEEKLLDKVNEIVTTADSRTQSRMLRYFVAVVPWDQLEAFYEEFKD